MCVLRPAKLAILALLVAAFAGVTALTAQEAKLWCEYEPVKDGLGKGKHVVLIAGDDEYRSEEALPMLGKILASRHGFRCTVLFPVNDKGIVQPNHQTNIPGMELVKDADLLILGLRFRNLPDEQMKAFDEYLESGKPMIGLRTSTHAFKIPKESKYAKYSFNYKGDEWKGGFGREVLGDTWINHHGRHGSQSTRGVPNEKNAGHAILKGVDDVWGPSDVYGIRNLPETATVLLDGQVIEGMKPTDKPLEGEKNDPMMPIAWVKDFETKSGAKSKIFCTTMGAATDFESRGLRRLVVNASLWCMGMESSITPELNVDVVGTYEPTKFGFKAFQKDRKPEFYELKTEEMKSEK